MVSKLAIYSEKMKTAPDNNNNDKCIPMYLNAIHTLTHNFTHWHQHRYRIFAFIFIDSFWYGRNVTQELQRHVHAHFYVLIYLYRLIVLFARMFERSFRLLWWCSPYEMLQSEGKPVPWGKSNSNSDSGAIFHRSKKPLKLKSNHVLEQRFHFQRTWSKAKFKCHSFLIGYHCMRIALIIYFSRFTANKHSQSIHKCVRVCVCVSAESSTCIAAQAYSLSLSVFYIFKWLGSKCVIVSAERKTHKLCIWHVETERRMTKWPKQRLKEQTIFDCQKNGIRCEFNKNVLRWKENNNSVVQLKMCPVNKTTSRIQLNLFLLFKVDVYCFRQ